MRKIHLRRMSVVDFFLRALHCYNRSDTENDRIDKNQHFSVFVCYNIIRNHRKNGG